MRNASTANQLEQISIHWEKLRTSGWVAFQMSCVDKLDFPARLLQVASEFGVPTNTRFRGSICDALLPTKALDARPRSLSRLYSLGEFPLHNDTAHWLQPCHYIMLACISPGRGSRATLLIDTQRLQLQEHQSSLLQSTPLRVTNGRNSFFSTILSKSRPFVRFDPGCMTATTPEGSATLDILSRHNWPEYVEQVHWSAGDVVILDNWRILHGRANAEVADPDRKLLRISIR